jgi:hypothetical protein
MALAALQPHAVQGESAFKIKRLVLKSGLDEIEASREEDYAHYLHLSNDVLDI